MFFTENAPNPRNSIFSPLMRASAIVLKIASTQAEASRKGMFRTIIDLVFIDLFITCVNVTFLIIYYYLKELKKSLLWYNK